MIVLSPLHVYGLNYIVTSCCVKTGKRESVMGEIVRFIEAVKFYSLERVFEAKINYLRRLVCPHRFAWLLERLFFCVNAWKRKITTFYYAQERFWSTHHVVVEDREKPDLIYFTSSKTPIWKLSIPYSHIYLIGGQECRNLDCCWKICPPQFCPTMYAFSILFSHFKGRNRVIQEVCSSLHTKPLNIRRGMVHRVADHFHDLLPHWRCDDSLCCHYGYNADVHTLSSADKSFCCRSEIAEGAAMYAEENSGWGLHTFFYR